MMNRIHILDCTLRDGGYCNEWKFGVNNIRRIINGLNEANIDIIECGFLSHRVSYQAEISKFSSMAQVMPFISDIREEKKFVLMANYGELDIDKLETRGKNTVDGIRLTFHKKDLNEAMRLCQQIKDKGYDVFVQAMVSLNYSDAEFLNLIQKTNELAPYAFYIVDSFGVMKQSDLIRLFYLVEHNLDSTIKIGYHSHNNLQLAYSNAQALVGVETTRELILDSSVMGMGRGAGNLNTELFLEYLNNAKGCNYDTKPILRLIDEIINRFYQENYWGYSLPNYLSAKHNIHPNYAKYLSDKNTLTVADMDTIFNCIDYDKRVNYDKNYIEDLYLSYMKKGEVNAERLCALKQLLIDKKVLLIAPGRSSEEEKDKIFSLINEPNVVSISVNFDYKGKTDFIFMSNIRRFKVLDCALHNKVVATSNINVSDCFVKVNYAELINDTDRVSDNAGLMLIKLLINLGIKEVTLAGFDGYSYGSEQNYGETMMELAYKKSDLEALNKGMGCVLEDYSKYIKITFFTPRKV